MADIALRQLSPDTIDLVFAVGDLAADASLETSILISLFSDARVSEDELPEGEASQRGYWGDMIAEVAGDRFGSKLWLLAREKLTDEVLERAREYAQAALQWLVDDGVAESVTVETEAVNTSTLGIGVQIKRPREAAVSGFRFEMLWNGQLARG